MEWKLDDSRPIWMQLEEQLTRRILSGWYKAGEKLPTVRDLAAEAGVNPIPCSGHWPRWTEKA